MKRLMLALAITLFLITAALPSMADGNAFPQCTLQCYVQLCCNHLNSRWPPKSLRRRERHAHRGLRSWVQKRGQRMADLIGFFMFGSR